MKITLEITEYRYVVTDAYRRGYSCGYKVGKKEGVKDALKKDIHEIPFESDYFLMDNALYLCTLHSNEVTICEYKDGQFHKHEGSKEVVKIEDIYKWKRI